jgi:hypothetical protein
MDAAVDRLLQAIERKERVVLYGDYDVDGVTSLTILTPRAEGLRLQRRGVFSRIVSMRVTVSARMVLLVVSRSTRRNCS